MVFSFFRNRRRKSLLAQPLPEAQRHVVERNVAAFALLRQAEQEKLIAAARIIAAERPFVACGGQVMSDEVKLTIAAQASLLLLGEEGYYFEKLPSILVYPMAYARRHSLGGSGPVDEDAGMLGESWQRGSIVLSWPAVLAGGRDPRDGQNLVLHEFAHHLDSLDGEMGGLPPLPTHEAETRWIAVFGREYDRLCHEAATGQKTLLDVYGTTSKAELFAVATECFFEQPIAMREQHPELFECFREFYKIDPSVWFAGSGPTNVSQGGPVANHADAMERIQDHPTAFASIKQPPLDSADQYFTRGLEHFEEGQIELAEADFNQAVRLAPDDQEALLYRGRCRLFLNHDQAALADAERACKLQPRDQEAICLRAMCRTALRHYRDAVADFDRSADACKDDVSALFYRGAARAECGILHLAIADFSRVIELDPQDGEAWFERGQCYADLGDRAAAERDLAKARKLGISAED